MQISKVTIGACVCLQQVGTCVTIGTTLIQTVKKKPQKDTPCGKAAPDLDLNGFCCEWCALPKSGGWFWCKFSFVWKWLCQNFLHTQLRGRRSAVYLRAQGIHCHCPYWDYFSPLLSIASTTWRNNSSKSLTLGAEVNTWECFARNLAEKHFFLLQVSEERQKNTCFSNLYCAVHLLFTQRLFSCV